MSKDVREQEGELSQRETKRREALEREARARMHKQLAVQRIEGRLKAKAKRRRRAELKNKTKVRQRWVRQFEKNREQDNERCKEYRERHPMYLAAYKRIMYRLKKKCPGLDRIQLRIRCKRMAVRVVRWTGEIG